MATYGVGPQGRVRAAERDFAQGNISYRDMASRVRAEGYTPAKAADVRDQYKRSRRSK